MFCALIASLFFFFKQKTAYEMRISDWSSDVCSSDLVSAAGGGGGALNRIAINAPLSGQVVARSVTLGQTVAADAELFRVANLGRVAVTLALSPADAGKVRPGSQIEILAGDRRSVARVDFVSPILDEKIGRHTSEIQSLM